MASSEFRPALPLLAFLLTGCAGLTATSTPTEWTALPLTDAGGRTTSVSEVLAPHRATVIVFWATQCPCVRRYQERVETLAAAWAARDVAFVGVDSNADDSLEDMARVAASRGVTLPLWRDEGGRLAKALGARSTPTVVLVERDGRVRYRGWLDNERLPGEADREPWLEQALAGLLEGTPSASASPTWGCAITRSLKSVPQCHAPTVAASASTSPGAHP
jgi:peroxiredoxin